jgi:hypothetical protein
LSSSAWQNSLTVIGGASRFEGYEPVCELSLDAIANATAIWLRLEFSMQTNSMIFIRDSCGKRL